MPALARALPLAVLAVCLLVARVAPAAPEGDARAQKRLGDEAMESGRAAEALAHYESAYALAPGPVLIYNIGRAKQALADYPGALAALERFRREAPASMKDRVPGLDELIDEVRGKVHFLTVRCDVEGATIRLRDRSVGACPTSLVTNAGEAELEVTSEGTEAYRTVLRLEGGGTSAVDVALAPLVRPGRLAVLTMPKEARVQIDGASTAPGAFVSLTPGRHQVEVRADGFRPATRQVDVEPGRALRLQVELQREPRLYERPLTWIVAGGVIAATVTVVALTVRRPAEDGSIPPGTVSAGLVRF